MNQSWQGWLKSAEKEEKGNRKRSGGRQAKRKKT
jgi:hypothetical protein